MRVTDPCYGGSASRVGDNDPRMLNKLEISRPVQLTQAAFSPSPRSQDALQINTEVKAAKGAAVDSDADADAWRIDTSLHLPQADDDTGLYSPLAVGLSSMSTPTPMSVHAYQRTNWRDDDEASPLAAPRATSTSVEPPAMRGSTLKPLSASQRRICLDSFRDKYAEDGFFPIREAIDMYHAVNASHVNFSKAWMLVDPDSVCKLDRTKFCAFIAVVNSIMEQKEGVMLPTTALGEAELDWLAREVDVGTVDVAEGVGSVVVRREEALLYDEVPLESSWRTAVGEGEGEGTEKEGGRVEVGGSRWSLGKTFAKLSRRKCSSSSL